MVYVDENYAGASLALGVGRFVLPDLVKNKVSSLRVPAGLKAKIIDKDDCVSGASLVITSDTSSLRGTGLNDDVACVIVSR